MPSFVVLVTTSTVITGAHRTVPESVWTAGQALSAIDVSFDSSANIIIIIIIIITKTFQAPLTGAQRRRTVHAYT